MIEHRRLDGSLVYKVDDDGKITALGLEATAADVKTQGRFLSRQDVDVEEVGKGVILKSANGHRQRIQVSNLSVVSAVDLDT